MNLHAIGAIYRFEMARAFRTLTQSIASSTVVMKEVNALVKIGAI